MPLCAFVFMYLVVICWERADLLALVCGVWLLVCRLPIGILDQVWYLIASVPDLCTLTYFVKILILDGKIDESRSVAITHAISVMMHWIS